MLTPEEIERCQSDYEQTEMADLSTSMLRAERDRLYHKWFAKLLDHAQGRTQAPWLAGIRTDDEQIRKVIGENNACL